VARKVAAGGHPATVRSPDRGGAAGTAPGTGADTTNHL